jgi:hypothetical protein
MATNNYYFSEKETEKRASAKRKKKRFFTTLGVLAAGAGAAYLYHKGFSNGAEKMKSLVQKAANDNAGFGAACGYARARLDDGTFDAASVKEFLAASVDKLTEEGLMSPGAVTDELIDTITTSMVMDVDR